MGSSEELLDQVQELTWALIDDEIDEMQLVALEKLLLDDDEARRTYVQCMQMHADLQIMFNDRLRQPLPPVSSRLPQAVVNALPITGSQMPLTGT